MTKSEAERQICAILAALETDSGMLINSISVNDIYITNMSSTTKELVRSVEIELHRLPGHSWCK